MVSSVQKGQSYYCEVCGCEVTVVRAGGAQPEPVCCQRRMTLRDVLFTVLRCPICGAEVTVLDPGTGTLEPICCNEPMEPLQVA